MELVKGDEVYFEFINETDHYDILEQYPSGMYVVYFKQDIKHYTPRSGETEPRYRISMRDTMIHFYSPRKYLYTESELRDKEIEKLL